MWELSFSRLTVLLVSIVQESSWAEGGLDAIRVRRSRSDGEEGCPKSAAGRFRWSLQKLSTSCGRGPTDGGRVPATVCLALVTQRSNGISVVVCRRARRCR
jgi:hypothetical protein